MMKSDVNNDRRWIGDSINDFEIGCVLGVGAFATVHQARCLKQGPFKDLHVAVKKIRKVSRNKEELNRRVRQEMEIHSSLHHPSIVKFYTCFEDDDCFYLVLELCQNGSLEEYLKKNEHPFSEDEARQILKPVIQGVIYMHQYNIIHRDLSLRNLLLTKDMQVKIADFGLAAKLSCPEEKKYTMLGTANFMSPEVATRTPHDLATDCWGIGCILYALLVGKPPFDNGGVKRTLTDVVMSDYKIPEHLSSDARHLISSLLKKNPEERIKIDAVLKHMFFINGKSVSINSLHYSQRTFDSGLGSTGTSSLTASSQSVQSRYRPSSNAKKSLETINSSGYSYHCDGSYGESPNGTDMYHNHRRDDQHYANLQHLKLKNEKNHELHSVRQLKHKIPPLPSNQPDFLRTVSSPIMPYTQSNGHQRNMYEEKRTQEPSDGYIHNHVLDQDAYPEKVQRVLHENRERLENFTRSRSKSPVKYDRNYPREEANVCNKISQNCTDECSCHHSSKTYDNCNKRINPSYHNPRNQCIDNHHRGNSRSPTRCHVSNEMHNNPNPHANYVCQRCCQNSQEDLPTQDEPRHHNCHLPTTHPDHIRKETHMCQPQGNSCSHERLCTDGSMQCSHSSSCACRSINTCNVANCGQNSNHSHSDHSVERPIGVSKFVPAPIKPVSTLRQSVPPLNTTRLLPRKQFSKHSVISILKDGDVCLQFLKEKGSKRVVYEVFRISKDGMWITIYKPNSRCVSVGDEPSPVPESGADFFFSYESLPEQYWKKYIHASRFVNYISAHQPKITFYGTSAKGVLMENTPDPNFEVRFYEGGKITKLSDRITMVSKSGQIYRFDGVDDVKNLVGDPEEIEMWEEFFKIYNSCVVMEKQLETLDATVKSLYPDDAERSSFPAILGRKPRSYYAFRDNNKENITPTSVRSSAMNTPVSDIRSFAETINTNYSPSDTASQKSYIPSNSKNKRVSSRASIKSNESDAICTKKIEDILPKVNHLSKDKQGNFQVKYKDGVDVYSSKALTAVHFYDRNTGKSYDVAKPLPPKCREKLNDVPCIAFHFEKQRKKIA